MKVAVRSRVLPEARRPRTRHLGAPPGARGGARGRADRTCRAAPARAAAGGAAPGGAATGRELAERLRQPRHEVRDGIPVTYVPYVSPPRPGFYALLGGVGRPALALALRALRLSFDFDLSTRTTRSRRVMRCGACVRRATRVSRARQRRALHGARGSRGGARGAGHPRGGVGRGCEQRGNGRARERLRARRVRVVHLGADIPRRAGASPLPPLQRRQARAAARGKSRESTRSNALRRSYRNRWP